MIDHPWKLLLIDSDPADAELASKRLKQAFADCQCINVADAVAFAEQLAVGGFAATISGQKPGLALCERILASHGGQIRANSGGRRYCGATFNFTLKKAGLARRGMEQAQGLKTGIRP